MLPLLHRQSKTKLKPQIANRSENVWIEVPVGQILSDNFAVIAAGAAASNGLSRESLSCRYTFDAKTKTLQPRPIFLHNKNRRDAETSPTMDAQPVAPAGSAAPNGIARIGRVHGFLIGRLRANQRDRR